MSERGSITRSSMVTFIQASGREGGAFEGASCLWVGRMFLAIGGGKPGVAQMGWMGSGWCPEDKELLLKPRV